MACESFSYIRVVLLLCAGLRHASTQEVYTSNAICRANYCTNPIFPGLNDLARLELLTWQCPSVDRSAYAGYMNFCGNAVLYPPALPSPNSTATPINTLVKAQDDAAATMFFYHLNGLGYEAWEHQQPWKSSDECVRSTWRMVCYTYFPKAQAGCQAGQGTRYLRPCRDCCLSYLQACRVECCDESPQCVFSHTLDVGNGQALLQTGYVDATGPSALCTGMGGSHGLSAPLLLILGLLGVQWMAASSEKDTQSVERRQSSSSFSIGGGWSPLLVVFALVMVSTTLSGCDYGMQSHTVGNWRSKEDYLISYEFVPPGRADAEATLNSCSSDVAATLQCNGKGYCRNWDSTTMSSVSFCLCDRDWADPECRTQRKSQVKVFFLSLFGGVLGLDYFYLGLPLWGLSKLLTLGGLGVWWLVDVVRTGSGPVYASDFRVAPDLPHWVFVIVTTFLFIVIGFVWAMTSYFRFRAQKRTDVLMIQEAEESRKITKSDELAQLGPQYYPRNAKMNFASPHGFTGYGSTLPLAMPTQGVPYGVAQPGPYAGSSYANAAYGIRL